MIHLFYHEHPVGIFCTLTTLRLQSIPLQIVTPRTNPHPSSWSSAPTPSRRIHTSFLWDWEDFNMNSTPRGANIQEWLLTCQVPGPTEGYAWQQGSRDKELVINGHEECNLQELLTGRRNVAGCARYRERQIWLLPGMVRREVLYAGDKSINLPSYWDKKIKKILLIHIFYFLCRDNRLNTLDCYLATQNN